MELIDITFIAPKIGAGRFRNQYATTNTIPNWYRYYKPKISSAFKLMLKEWYLPENEGKPANSATVTFKIKRKYKIKIDPDAFSASACKWAIDLLVEQKYLIDDDKVRIILEPPEIGCKDVNETVIHMTVDFYNNLVE